MDPESIRAGLPEGPGVYLFRDRSDQIIYVGKAKDLKKRVLSYFKPSPELPHKTALMMKRAAGLDYIITSTENEAFILESSLIKRHMPRYNIVLRDDKQYPWLRLDIKESYPRLAIVRRPKKDGAVYFGPFSSANSVRSTVKVIDRIFRLRKCKGSRLPKRSRPCLNYQLGRCLGPCTSEIPEASYREIVDQVRLFLEGRNRELIKQLKKDMKNFSEEQDFENAARIRDQIRAVENTIERQDVVSARMEDQDVIGIAKEDGASQLVILFVRKGSLTGSRDYYFRDQGASPSEVMEAFLKQYYHREAFIPGNIIISEPVEELEPIADWLSEMAGRRVSIHHPLRGTKRRIVGLAVSNAQNLLTRSRESRDQDLMELTKSALRLKKTPKIIEGLDISNIQGDMAVGTVVSFVEGSPNKAGYRNYRIKGVDSIDDYGMMSELVSRRLSKEKPPDLFVVDGGKGHLLTVKKVVDELPGDEIPDVVAIAKADEGGPDRTDKVFIPGRKNPLSLKKDHPVLFLLMRIRDEAHRRAVTHHRKIRGKGLRRSRLDLVPGIGPKRKRLLLERFGDAESISRARPEELALIPGIGKSLARDISGFFQKEA